ncbi:MAG: hypothetical protein QOE83_2246 [Actinomycetota bacterium]|jgi:excisionase family DNA binding protein|nr:hypothetical protein [Actinomycetota bacterium]
MDDRNNIPRLLLKADRAAEVLDTSRTRIYELIASGELESVRLGGTRRIPQAALVDLVERLRAEGSSGEGDLPLGERAALKEHKRAALLGRSSGVRRHQ